MNCDIFGTGYTVRIKQRGFRKDYISGLKLKEMASLD